MNSNSGSSSSSLEMNNIDSIHTVEESSMETTTGVTRQQERVTNKTPITVPGTAAYSEVTTRTTNSSRNSQRGTFSSESEQNGASNKSVNLPNNNSKRRDNEQKIQVIINGRSSDQRTSQNRPLAARRIESARKSKSKKNILLMGDSILNRINTKGLNSNVHKHSVSGATLENLMTDIDLYDISQLDSIILYIGRNDINGSKEHSTIAEQYDKLVAIIRSRNPNCKVLLSKIAPRGYVNVKMINDIIERVAIHHKCDIVDNYRAFFDKHGQLITRFYNNDDPVHPSNFGTKRILGTINDLVNIVRDFQFCVFQRSATNYYPSRNSLPNFGSRPINQLPQWNNVNTLPQSNTGRCLNCYDSSHTTIDCRHKRPIKCWFCGILGHKQSFCWN